MASLVQHPFRRIRRFTRTRSRVEVLFVVIWVLAWVPMGSTKWISPAGRASARAASPVQRVRMSPADASSADLRLTSIDCSTNGVALSVAWDGGAFALPPFLEFFARTNLVAGGWELVGWTQAVAGETNLDVVVESDRLPGGTDTVPSAAFFSVAASDGLGGDEADDDRDGLSNAEERARGTNPRRADTDGDGYPDGEEVAYAATGRELPDFDLSDLPDAFAGTLPYDTYPAAIAVDLPFAVELAGRRSTRAIVHFCGTVTFPVVGSTVNAQNYALSTRPSSLYAASHAVVAAYGLMFMPMGYSGSQLRAGIVHASNGRWFVAEWRNMMDAAGFTQLSPGYATFQLAVAESDPGTVHVRYLSLTGGLDGTDALVGAHGFNGAPDLLVADGVPGSVSSGDVISYRFGTGTDPLDPDTDGDGLRDGWEAEHGMDPRVPNDASDPRLAPDADPDNDGLANRRESELGTDPFQPDSDNDGLDDGWESRYADFGFDPLVPNVNGAIENTGPDEDLDGDGLTNREECGCGTDPGARDTDRDGVDDGAEVARNSDPADAEDGGRPNSRVLATLTLGDHSRSQSEKYCLTFTPVPGSGPGGAPAAISRISARYDGCAPLTVPLKPGWRYEVRLDHAGSDPAYTGTPKPDYDYTLEFSPKPESVLLDDPQGLFGVHGWDDGPFLARDKAATATVYKVDVAICAPNGDSWTELDASRVVLDDEELRVKVTVSPQMDDLAACRRQFGDTLRIRTTGTCPQGVTVPLDDAVFANVDGKSEIRVAKTFAQLRELGLLPAQDEDGVNEMAWLDMATSSSGNLSDSLAFEGLGYVDRGRATLDATETLESQPPSSIPSESYFKAAGREVVTVEYGGSSSSRRQIMNQGDYLYFSGHGFHDQNRLQGGFTPAMVEEYWSRDLDVAIIAGCSVLDVNDYNGNYPGQEHDASPGEAWERTGPAVLLGYNYSAPGDAGGAPTRIVNQWRTNRAASGDVNAWMDANAANHAWNACAIVKGQKYVYFEKFFFKKFKKLKEISKGAW